MRSRSTLLILTVGALAAFGPITGRAAGPDLINYQAFLTDDNGDPVEGTADLTFTIYDAESDGMALWTEAHPGVEVSGGIFHTLLGSLEALPPSVFDGAEVWLETSVDGTPVTPRRRFVSVPYAMRAAVADVALSGGDADNDWTVDGDDMHSSVSGDVGIGTEAPSGKLEVADGDDPMLYVRSTDTSGDDAGVVVRGSRNASTTADVAYVELRDFDDDEGAGTDFAMAKIAGGMEEASGQKGNLRFYTNDGGGPAERMRVTSDGDVGIGTTNPQAKLDVVVPTVDPVRLRLRAGVSWPLIMEMDPSSLFTISNGGSQRFALTSGGAVGIGTTAPTHRLSVAGRIDAGSYLANDDLGPSSAPADGGVYGDNVVYAWGYIEGDGTIVDSFGIEVVTRMSTGFYDVDLSRALQLPVVSVTGGGTSFIVTSLGAVGSSSFEVLRGRIVGGVVDLEDGPFTVVVTGRP